MDDSGEGRTLQDCAGEHRPGLNTSIMLHLSTALRAAYYDGLSSPPVPHDVINAAVPVDRQPRALSAFDPRDLRPESFDLGRQLDQAEQLGPLADNG